MSLRHCIPILCLALVLQGAAVVAALAADGTDGTDGPGLGKVTFAANEMGMRIDLPRADRQVRNAYMHNGWFAYRNYVLDMSNPRQPRQVASNFPVWSPHTLPTFDNYLFDERRVYDATDMLNVRQVSTFTAPVLWRHLQYPYLYAVSSYENSVAPMRIVDFSDIRNPVTVADIDVRSLIGFEVGSVHVIGNLMILSAGQQRSGNATLDLSDPLNPRLLAVNTEGPGMYFSQVYGDRIYTTGPVSRDRLGVFDFSDPTDIRTVVTGEHQAMGDYANFQGGYVFTASPWNWGGRANYWGKFSVEDLNNGIINPVASGNMGVDQNRRYAIPAGNLVWVGSHTSIPEGMSSFFVHQLEPDNEGPRALYVNPVDGAEHQARTTRIGFSFSDYIDNRSLTPDNIIVRPIGGEPIATWMSHQMGIVNITPRQPLLADTTYEVIVVAGGLRDWSNNGGEGFRSVFSTGRLEVEPPTDPAVTILSPAAGSTVEGNFLLQFQVDRWDMEPGGRHLHLFINNVDQGPHYSTDPIAVDALNPGTYTLRLELAEADHSLIGTSHSVTITVREELQPTPYGGEAQGLPGRILAAHFDEGGPGVAYYDSTPTNQGGAYRLDESVDVQVSSLGGHNIGWTVQGEWLIYTVQVDQAGIYAISAQTASEAVTGALALDVNGQEIVPSTSVPATGGWQTWQELDLGEAYLPSGELQFRLRITGSEFNLAWFDITLVSADTGDLIIRGPATDPQQIMVNEEFTVSVQAQARQGGTLEYQWNFSDGSGNSAWSSSASSVAHTYSQPGFYTIFARVRENGGSPEIASLRVLVQEPVLAERPRQSTTIALDEARDRVWTVNEDHGSVSMIDVAAGTLLQEISVGGRPRAVAVDDNGRVWVSSEANDVLRVIDADSGGIIRSVELAYGSAPYGVVADPNADRIYASLAGTGEVIAINGASGEIVGRLTLAEHPRSLALAEGALYVAHFITPHLDNHISVIDVATFTQQDNLTLPFDTQSDAENAGGGIINYVGGLAVAPTGNFLWYPATKANALRGTLLSGNDLNHENTVRTVAGHVNLRTGNDDPDRRIDFDDSALAMAVTFGPSASFAFVAILGNNRIEVIDTAGNAPLFQIRDVGLAPDGMVIDSTGQRLFVHAFNSRRVSVFDISHIKSELRDLNEADMAITTISEEVLSPEVLLGKQIFYNAADPRMSLDSYISCASCHFQGGSDGRVWDFTGRGEGLRYTTELWGRSGTEHGRVHWSANFDEIQDFEHDIRDAFLGTGFMSDEDFNSGTRNQPLGDRKAGLSAELDALAAYVSSLDRSRVPRSPYRQPDGNLSPAALRGRAIFFQQNCNSCHGGSSFTDSQLSFSLLHDVGTLSDSSGQRLGGFLWGIDTPTLRGVWRKDVFLHDGSAGRLEDVFLRGDDDSVHGIVRQLSTDDQADLMVYLRSLDGRSSDEPGHQEPRRRIRVNLQGVECSIAISPQHGLETETTTSADFAGLSDALDYTLRFIDPPNEVN